ncbi:hypothetical protein PQU94_00840 [Asticcacaulis sp. DXS10W]|uniref:PglD N-terminal domain-containing protein n=1 Tax=Asticcacaulis currens TaxID=2984210 RepID=A0ABT5IA06_9CAUL|nr:hypothetical protein [Asticcacaulis currens]MDC7692818.1 hypothetical protein [Asticcacaulis currens]
MKKIIVYGGGGLALEVVSYLKDIERTGTNRATFAGVFVPEAFCVRSDDVKRIEPSASVFRSLDDIDPDAFEFVIGIGDPILRYRLHNELKTRNFGFYTLIHPSAVVDRSSNIGEGSVLAPFTFVGPCATIGASTLLNTYASVGHDASVGSATALSPYACLNGNAVTGRACFLGSHAALSPGAKIGDMSKLSAGSIFAKVADAGSIIHGNPAKARVMMRVNLD